jgi:GNAT superfamily N-acetyltransferase
VTVIRPARPGDGDSVARFLTGLSPTSRYQRFFTDLPKMSTTLIESLVVTTAERRVLLAWADDVVIGHAIAVRTGNLVDFGVVVAESHRRQGIGGRLVGELADDVSEVHCDVLCGNYFVLRWLRRLLSGMRAERVGDTITVRGRIAGPLTYKDYVIPQSLDPVDRG